MYTVVLCTYQPSQTLFEQISSINKSFESTGIGFSTYISDDTHSYSPVVKELVRLDSDRIRLSSGPMLGSACYNFVSALTQTQSEWVFLSDQDDIWEVNKVDEYLKIIKKLDNDIPQIIFSDASLIDDTGRIICESFFKYQGLSEEVLNSDDILFKNCVQGATLCMNREMINLINETLDGEDSSSLAMHDWWIAILARYCGNWTFINKPLLRYRQHDRNVVGAIKESNVLVKFLKNPFIYYRKLKTLKCQYQLWLRVSERLKERSSFNCRKMNISFLSKCKLLVIRLIP